MLIIILSSDHIQISAIVLSFGVFRRYEGV